MTNEFEPEEQAFWPSVVECLEQVGVSVSHREFPDRAVSVERRALVSLASDLARLPALRPRKRRTCWGMV